MANDFNKISMFDWQPVAHIDMLRRRATLYQQIREFFQQRNVLEVETPILSAAAVPEPSIEPLHTTLNQQHRRFLQTSPELAMKRLLAAGSGAIYQISKVFRDEEDGRWHQPEFTLLEWYRPHFTPAQLCEEVDQLLQQTLKTAPAETRRYADILMDYTGLSVTEASLKDWQRAAAQAGAHQAETLNRDQCLQLIMSLNIEAQLGLKAPLFIIDFPSSQAALARRCTDDERFAERFELYVQGVELANGFHELADADEQRQRFIADLQTRQAQQQAVHPLDERFLAALQDGQFPDCSGVALGLDRLLMLQTGSQHIREILAFPSDRA